MQEVRKLAKNVQWFRPIIQKAPINYKQQARKTQMDENKLTYEDFCEILDFIASEAEITPPTKQQKFQLFQEFNDGKNQDFLVKQEWEKLVNRLCEMLQAAVSN